MTSDDCDVLLEHYANTGDYIIRYSTSATTVEDSKERQALCLSGLSSPFTKEHKVFPLSELQLGMVLFFVILNQNMKGTVGADWVKVCNSSSIRHMKFFEFNDWRPKSFNKMIIDEKPKG